MKKLIPDQILSTHQSFLHPEETGAVFCGPFEVVTSILTPAHGELSSPTQKYLLLFDPISQDYLFTCILNKLEGLQLDRIEYWVSSGDAFSFVPIEISTEGMPINWEVAEKFMKIGVDWNSRLLIAVPSSLWAVLWVPQEKRILIDLGNSVEIFQIDI